RDAVRTVHAGSLGPRRDDALHRRDVRIARPEVGNQSNTPHRVHYTSPVFATIPPPAQRLLVFARLPELGKVKTRLAQSIGAEKALAVYEAMLRDLLQSIGTSNEETEIEIFWTPTDGANGEALRRAFDDHALAMQR